MNPSSRALFLGLALSFAATRAFAGCQPLWEISSPPAYVQGTFSAIADFDSDGVSDLAVIRATAAMVLITDETAGKPGPPVTVAQGTSFTDIEAADVNGDGKTDLILADSGAFTVSVLPGNGDGTFGTAVTTTYDVAPTEIAIADFKADGKPDLAIRSTTAFMITAAGNGSGQFTELQRSALPTEAVFPITGDFDGDTKADVLVMQWNISSLQLFRGNGNGTLAAPAKISLSYASHRYKAFDFDADGDLDLAVSHLATNMLEILRNDGTGAFTPFGEYNTKMSSGVVHDIAAADVTQDGVADLVLALPNDRVLATLAGKGDATFEPAVFTIVAAGGSPTKVFLSDFDGDERNDALFLTGGQALMASNRCGDAQLFAKAVAPVVSVGQPAIIEASVFPTSNAPTNPEWPRPSGTVTIYEDSTPVATRHADRFSAEQIEIEGLPVGTHTLRAVYGGDDRYDEAESTTFTVRVTTETTSVTVVPSKTAYKYMETITLVASIYSSTGGGLRAGYRLSIDGGPFSHPQSDPYFYVTLQSVGEHTFRVQYPGDADHPPSISAPVMVRVDKAPTTATLGIDPGPVTRLGDTDHTPFGILVNPYAAGTVELYDGATLIATKTMAEGHVEFFLPLSLGRHVLTAKYLGNENFLPSKVTFEHTVVQNLPSAIDATAVGNTIHVAWAVPGGGTGTILLQRLVNGVWTEVVNRPAHVGQTYIEPSVTPGVVYVYRVQAFDWNLNLLGTSPIDIATVTAFTDDPLTPRVTRIRAAHLTQIIATTNTLRAAAGLAPISVPNIAPGKPIKPADILAIRAGIQSARAHLGLANYPFTNTLAAGAPVRAIDIQELRNALR